MFVKSLQAMHRIAVIAMAGVCGVLWAHGAPTIPPVVALKTGTTWVDEIGFYVVSYHGLDGRAGAFPIGWTGMFDEATGVSATEFGEQNGRRGYLLHPMWRGSAGNADQSYRVTLPQGRAAHLRFGVAISTAAQGKSDGVTFRVFVNGAPAFEKNTNSETWTDADIDLSAYAGRTVALTFETDPGPKHDPGYDFGIWGDRRIVVSGAETSTAPAASAAPYRLDAPQAGWGWCSPTWPLGVRSSVKIASHIDNHPIGFVGGMRFDIARTKTSKALTIPFANYARVNLVAPDGSIVASDDPSVRSATTQERLPNDVVRRVTTYTLGTRTVHLTTEISPYAGSCVRIDARSDDPEIASVNFGVIGPEPLRRDIVVPYLETGTVRYLPDAGLFSSVFLDFAISHASRIDGPTAFYGALTDGTRNPVRETAYFALSPDFASVLPTPPNPASPYRAELGGKIVLDHWRNIPFDENAAWLDLLASYGLTDILTIAHVWQNGGYDNKLPDTLPALESLGGNEGMRAWIAAAKRHGERIALHDNYADFYPNAASFDWADVPHDSNNQPILAWKNLIQSYAVAPSAIVKIASVHEPRIARDLSPNAGYLDVHSSTVPDFHVDYRAGTPGAGKMQTVRSANAGLWALTRRTYGGPVLGEGAHDWMWAGLLDGVEGQFGVGVPGNAGQSAPLFVDFALHKVHPRMLNHGMGYLERWLAKPSPIETLPASVLDQYRMQEIIYGHAGFAANLLVDSLPFLWREHNLVIPVSHRYATLPVRAIQYDVDGVLRDTNAAIAARSNFDRARVTYANGLKITANGRNRDWTVTTKDGKVTLAPYGWVAESADLLAYTARRDGRIVDFARTPKTIFADCRAVPLVSHRKFADVTPKIEGFRQTGIRQFEIAFAWTVRAKVPADEVVFVHVVRAHDKSDIFFQIPSGLPAPSEWPVGGVQGQPVTIALPSDLADGEYAIRTGLYSPKSGERLSLHAGDDGETRSEIGILRVSGSGSQIEIQREDALAGYISGAQVTPPRAPIDFGPLATDGSVLLERLDPKIWRVTPMPRDIPFTVAIDPVALGLAPNTLQILARDIDNRVLAPLVSMEKSKFGTKWRQFRVNTIPGAVRYELRSAAGS